MDNLSKGRSLIPGGRDEDSFAFSQLLETRKQHFSLSTDQEENKFGGKKEKGNNPKMY